MLRHILISMFIASLHLFSLHAIAGGAPTVSGTISRDTSVDRFDFTITVTDSTKPDLTTKEKDLFKDRLRIYLKDLSARDNEYVPFAGSPEIVGIPFTVNQNGDVVKKTNSSGKTDFTFFVRITANAKGGLKKLLDDKGGGKTIALNIRYYEDESLVDKNEAVTLSISTEIVEGAPSTLTASGTHRSIVASWTNPSTYDWSGTSTETPSKVMALVMDKSATELDIPTYLYNSASATDSAGPEETCMFVPTFVDGEACITCNDSTAYLDTDLLELMKAKGYFVTSATVSAGKVKIAGLENAKPYAVALFYQPGGLQRTTCVTATPEADSTWSEVNGEDSASLSDPKCFIATAAYGSPLHRNLKPLRWFRDHVLQRVELGRDFISWYYQEGPKAARYIQDKPLVQTIVQLGLLAPVIVITSWMNLAQATSFAFASILLAMSLGVTTIFLAKKTLRAVRV